MALNRGGVTHVPLSAPGRTPNTMFPAIGIVVLLVMVFGGFAFTGGALGPVMEAIPHEMLIIGGAAAGALIIGNSGKELKALGGGLGKVFKGPKYKKQDYLDVIFLVVEADEDAADGRPDRARAACRGSASPPRVFAEYPQAAEGQHARST